jgi:hypothetical protein
MPTASNIFGTCESGVKPGMVLTSLRRTPSGVTKKSKRAMPRQPSVVNRVAAVLLVGAEDVPRCDGDLERGADGAAAVGVFEHRDIHLAPLDELFDQHVFVVAAGLVDSGRQVGCPGHPGHTVARPGGHGFHDDGVREAGGRDALGYRDRGR